MIQALSVIGSLLVLLAYALVQKEVVKPKSFWYTGLNLAGALMLGYVAVVVGMYGYIVLNVAWTLIALWGMREVGTWCK